MTANEIREKYLKFFEGRGHVRIAPSPLVLKDDPTTLFTSSGMQQLVPYLKGEKEHPEGKRLVDSQPSIRAHGKSDDILEVGDTRHLTIFEMLGNWSFGDPARDASQRDAGGYFKKEEIPWLWEFLTETLSLPKEKLWITVFEGTGEVPKDNESVEIWRKLGIPEERIYYYGVKKNWWSRSGTPEEMPAGEIGGPTTEVFYEFDSVSHRTDFGPRCHPNCDCGRFSEIGNSVFMQYVKNKDGSLSELPQKNVDFGGGLERLSAAVSNQSDAFKIDLFWPLIQSIERQTGLSYQETNSSAFRIISDHLKAAIFLIKDGVVPSNKEHGYVLRRLIRRAVAKLHTLNSETDPSALFKNLASSVVEIYKGVYFQEADQKEIGAVLEEEVKKFMVTLEKGLKLVEKIENIDAKVAFNLYQTYGFPFEITADIVKEHGGSLDVASFKKEFEKHRELSRTSSSDMFKAK